MVVLVFLSQKVLKVDTQSKAFARDINKMVPIQFIFYDLSSIDDATDYEVPFVKYVVKYNLVEFRINHTVKKTFFFFKDEPCSKETIFPLQKQIIQQQKRFSISKSNHTARKQFFQSKDKSYSNEPFFPFQRQIIHQRKQGELQSVK